MSFAELAPGAHAASVRNHWWWRPGWKVGRRFYACHPALGHEPELQRIVGQYRHALSGLPGLDFIPDKWLHLTLQGIGFTDEISDGDLHAIIAALQVRLCEIDPVAITLATAIVSDEAIVMPVEQVAAVAKLRASVRAAVAHVLGHAQSESRAIRYRPHVSIGYVNADGSARPYIDAIESVQPEPATLTVQSVPIISMHRDQQMYEWDELAVASLSR